MVSRSDAIRSRVNPRLVGNHRPDRAHDYLPCRRDLACPQASFSPLPSKSQRWFACHSEAARTETAHDHVTPEPATTWAGEIRSAKPAVCSNLDPATCQRRCIPPVTGVLSTERTPIQEAMSGKNSSRRLAQRDSAKLLGKERPLQSFLICRPVQRRFQLF
jgi:hypothetical protein